LAQIAEGCRHNFTGNSRNGTWHGCGPLYLCKGKGREESQTNRSGENDTLTGEERGFFHLRLRLAHYSKKQSQALSDKVLL